MRNPCRSPSIPARSRWASILQIYFSVAHDPTELDYQGPDSARNIARRSSRRRPSRRAIAKAYIAQLDQAHVFDAAIVTTIEPGRKAFYPAEGYHQNFLTLNPNYPYIVYNDLPKIENLKQLYPNLYRADPVLGRGERDELRKKRARSSCVAPR